ncbi:hypothetical protein GCM10009733_009120 [Nonomuraea maheshkhaliensis]|uniref:MFS transporter n=2 Tax=Nonomuraea maheshkhaliensis TaxID=419590 RepID=A0ABN2ERN0_9ACTN
MWWLDWAGMATFTLAAGGLTYGLGGLTYGLIEGGEHGWTAARTLVPLGAAAAAFACLAFTSLWLQQDLRLGPVMAGLALSPMALASLVTSVAASRLLPALTPRAALGGGLLLIGAGSFLQGLLGAESGWPALTPGLMTVGVGVWLAVPPLSAAAMAHAPAGRAGMAAGTVNTVRQLGYALGIAVLGIVYQGGGPAYAMLDDVYRGSALTGVLAGLLVLVTVTGAATRRA